MLLQDEDQLPALLPPPVLTGSLFFIVVAAVVICADWYLPTPLTAEQAGAAGFSEERARVHVKALSRMGPRTTGNKANEVLAPR